MPDLNAPVIVLFRDDLRLGDNPALHVATSTNAPVIPVFVLDEESGGLRPRGAAWRWWLHQSLLALSADLANFGSTLILRRGAMADVVPEIVRQTGAAAVFWNRRYEAASQAADEEALKSAGVPVRTYNANLLNEPWEIKTREGRPFRVYTAYWRACLARGLQNAPLPRPSAITYYSGPAIESDSLDRWGLLPTRPDWAGGMRETWTPGEGGAYERLYEFVDHKLSGYAAHRDEPQTDITARLSPHLSHGEISPRQIWAMLDHPELAAHQASISKFLGELGWREFAYHFLNQHPDLATRNVQTRFDEFGWMSSEGMLRAWQTGQTGYPIVDAAMRELWQTGWMHNRLRLIVGSFLVKHLLIDWRLGEQWFWDTLVDSDPANNALNWQWVAGTGADSAPYFRIFNPVLQGQRFDPEGEYIRRFVPELAELPGRYVHEPWRAPERILKAAGVVLKETYPRPIVDHQLARNRALSAFHALRNVDPEAEGAAATDDSLPL
ncbi:deoxyribodipyrimidine photo-lyase type I [Faunimonas pinastri]|uniref:Deoxyribodipyrimidine photo-lyase n=1 Tax=Faunimonas pinastri TaxID=1855383 RepID=A0A1H9CI80_9HYPH|nr:deoxyribodipyrimidine photo-lyase [Faunimonas pinastri]SEQ00916.1 deoxyribodipyrimidine photo-lyase type I [Faunimonas pinastri]